MHKIYKKAGLKKMSQERLIEVAGSLDIDADAENFVKDEVIDSILTAQDASGAANEGSADSDAGSAQSAKLSPKLKVDDINKEKRFKLTVHSEADQPDSTHVKLGINGYAYNIKLGNEVVVPERVIGALKDARMYRVRQNDKGESFTAEVQRFAFSHSPL